MPTNKIFIALRSGLFLAITGIIAWLIGEPMIFPSLGPTAYVLAFRPQATYEAKTIIGGHFCGAVGGIISYHLVVAPYHLNEVIESLSQPGLFMVLGAVLALFLTVLLMLIFEASHPPACATTLIISLGILSTWQEAGIIMISVVIMYISYRLYLKIYDPHRENVDFADRL